MRIGIVHRFDVADVKSLSGYPYFMAKALEKHVGEVTYIGPENSLLTRAIEMGGRLLNRISYLIFKRRIPSDHHRILSKRLAHTFKSLVENSNCDVLFAPVASVEIAYLSTDIPIIYFSDMTWFNLVDYYPTLSSLWRFAEVEGERLEQTAISNAHSLIYPSEWVAKTAVEHYRADPNKVHCIPFGANFGAEDIPAREEAIEKTLDEGIGLLWVGVDWHRKGGPIAHECLLELLSRGLNSKLVVCGCDVPEVYRHPKIEVIPFLNKSDPKQRNRLSQLFREANFLLFPTLAEAFGIVVCEASAYGLPTLARHTGGVGGAVTDGENGFLMDRDASGKQYAEKILDILEVPQAYKALVQSSRLAFETRLNWDAWGKSVKPIFEQAVKDSKNEFKEALLSVFR